MDTLQSFLDDIACNPHDDAPRLIFADWVEDNADLLPAGQRQDLLDRALLIRVQYAQEGLTPDDPRRAPLELRQRAILHAHPDWQHALPVGHSPLFRRGFIEGMTLSVDDLIHYPQALSACAPLRRLRLDNVADLGPQGVAVDRRALLLQAADSPLLEQVETLDLSRWRFPDTETAAAWFASPRLMRLSSLELAGESIHASALLASRLFQRLRTLVVHVTTPQVLSPAPFHPYYPPLATLELQLDDQREEAEHPVQFSEPLEFLSHSRLRRIAASQVAMRHLPAVPPVAWSMIARAEEIDLSHSQLDLQRIAQDGPFPHLRRLLLTTCLFPFVDLIQFLTPATAPALRALHLRNNRIGDLGIAALARTSMFAHLEALFLSYNRIGPEGAQAIAQRLPHGFRTLDLSWNAIGDEAVGRLAVSEGSYTLQALDLSYCGLGREAAGYLAHLPHDAPLLTLNLATNRIDDIGLATMLAAPGLQRLEALDLSNNALSDAGADLLMRSPLFHRLSLLVLSGNRLSARMGERLHGAFRGLLL